jgi:hypothetical protein
VRPEIVPAPERHAGSTTARQADPLEASDTGLPWQADAGIGLANQFTGEISDPLSLQDLRDAIQQRGPAALGALRAKLALLQRSSETDAQRLAQVQYELGTILTYLGRFDQAIAAIDASLRLCEAEKAPPQFVAGLTAVKGVVALRSGEVANCINCVGSSSCFFPIVPGAVHVHPAGSRWAIDCFTRSLELVPSDLRVRWLLNLAYMTLGEYPDQVPRQFLVPLDTFESAGDVGRFLNIAPLVGLTSRGPNQAGGSVFDDFTGDGLPDLFLTSLDVDRGASLFVNRGDGKFEDVSDSAGLSDQVYALNLARADFDNDGCLDVILLRGAWEAPMRLSLLRNTGHNSFEDVTIAGGMGEPISTESAVWGDYDNDGLVDLFVCGEYTSPNGGNSPGLPCNLCRLYHNEGRGKFVDVAASAGVTNERCAKGSAWGDYDGDGLLDLFVSNRHAPCRLYHNEGNGKFRDVASELNVEGPGRAFACWFWDYDNDGRLDLYVNDYASTLVHFVAQALQMPFERTGRPCLYHNIGAGGFQDVTIEAGLDREFKPMGSNFADIDNDGFLDFYLGTGYMTLEVLVPNLMFKNSAGKRFEDVTVSSGTGHLQKGHGVSFADWDCDGDLDLAVVAGGAVPGDRSFNLLFQNPGHGRHWIKVKLVGFRSNRAALGAQIKAVVRSADGSTRSIFRTVGNNSSFGGNSLVESIGLADDNRVAELEVFWPASHTTQIFHDLAADQAIEITEGVDQFKRVTRTPSSKSSAPGSL